MRVILFILQKEFKQIFRNRIMLAIIFVMPLVQTVVFVYAATLELKEANIAIMDYDNSIISQRLVAAFEASPFFNVKLIEPDNNQISELLSGDETKAVLVIPIDFESNIYRGQSSLVQVNISAVDGQSAGIINVYVQQIINNLSMEFAMSKLNIQMNEIPLRANISSRFWYNPNLNFKYFMLPGILVILITMIGTFLTSLNIVREKEMGTIEQINVTPIKRWQFLAGKLIPFWIIGHVVFGVGLLIGKLFYNLPFEGSPWTLLLTTGIYLFIAIGLGLLASNFAKTQQQAMFTIFFFFLTFTLMSGIFTSVESMPMWAQKVNFINPLYYYMKIIRAILLKGAGLKHIISEFVSMIVYGILVMILAVATYKKTS